MDFRQLETFVQVANLKSFSKAADKLFITQPTVTNHIQNLEKELDAVLINRFGKSITLTDAGNLLYKYAINILNSCEMAKFDLASYKGKIQGHIYIYSSSVPRKYLLPNIIKGFVRDYPDVTFTVEGKDSKKVVKGILDGVTDFGIVGAKYSSNSLEYIDLMEDELVLVTPNCDKYPEDNYSYISKDVFLNEKIFFREEGSGTRSLTEKVMEKAGIPINKLNIVGYIEDTEIIKDLIALGIGVSLLSKKTIEDDLKSKKFKAFHIKDMDFSRKFYFVYHKNRQLSPLSNTFKDHIIMYTKGQIL